MNIILEWNFKSWTFPTFEQAADFVAFWNFPETQYEVKQREYFRGFIIQPADVASRKQYCWMEVDGEEILGHADSVQECKTDIDLHIKER
jgi:hypothetical protein